MFIRSISVICMAIVLSGCATIISGTTDKVTLNSSPIGSTFFMKDQNGKPVNNGTTPMTVTLDRGEFIFDGQTYTIDFSAPGYSPLAYTLDSTLNPWYLGNILFGGALGILIIDPATGAMWDFPKDVYVSLTKMDSNISTDIGNPSHSPDLPPVNADQSYREIKAIELKNGNIIEGQILSLNTSTVKIRTKEGNVMSYSFEREVQRLIK